MNLPTLIAALLVAALLLAIVRGQLRQRRRGGGCAGCTGCAGCQHGSCALRADEPLKADP